MPVNQKARKPASELSEDDLKDVIEEVYRLLQRELRIESERRRITTKRPRYRLGGR